MESLQTESVRAGRSVWACLLGLAFVLLLSSSVASGAPKPSLKELPQEWQDPAWWRVKWIPEGATPAQERAELARLISVLKQTKFGRKMVQAAHKRYRSFSERIMVGEKSYTESTYSRTYSLNDGSEALEIENHLTINRGLSRIDALFDLAHEMIHFLFRKPTNPYLVGFSMPEFVRHGIEGKGGEVQAFEAECRVAWELERYAPIPKHRLCEKYRNQFKVSERGKRKTKFDRRQVEIDFYAVGNYYVTLQGLQVELPKLNNERPVFISSLENSPYPYALIQEFVNVRKMACENNARKARLIQQQAARTRDGREPAADLPSLKREYRRLSKYFKRHCQTELNPKG